MCCKQRTNEYEVDEEDEDVSVFSIKSSPFVLVSLLWMVGVSSNLYLLRTFFQSKIHLLHAWFGRYTRLWNAYPYATEEKKQVERNCFGGVCDVLREINAYHLIKWPTEVRKCTHALYYMWNHPLSAIASYTITLPNPKKRKEKESEIETFWINKIRTKKKKH